MVVVAKVVGICCGAGVVWIANRFCRNRDEEKENEEEGWKQLFEPRSAQEDRRREHGEGENFTSASRNDEAVRGFEAVMLLDLGWKLSEKLLGCV